MRLSKRLTTLVHAVTPGHRVADIGCDHALVAIALVLEGISPYVIASDVNRGPLMRAGENIAAKGLSDVIETRLGSGLDPVKPGEVDTVICAGMGGALMEEILLAGPDFFDAGTEFILSPHLEWDRIRRLMRKKAYKIEKEWFLKDDGKYYVVMKAKRGRNPQKGSSPQENLIADRYGSYLLETGDPLLAEYLEQKKEKEQKLLAMLKSRGDNQGIIKRIDELEKELFLTGRALYLVNKNR